MIKINLSVSLSENQIKILKSEALVIKETDLNYLYNLGLIESATYNIQLTCFGKFVSANFP